MPEGALADLKVLELGELVSAPYCCRLLADMGAEVIKVEPPEGDSARRHGPYPGDIPDSEKSALFLFLNFNKQSLTLNLQSSTGRKVFKELLRDVDLLVENCSLAVMEKLGLDYPSLEAINPRLVVTSISPYGCTGPYRYWKGTDLTATALSGLSLGRGEPNREPLAFPAHLAEFETGLAAAIASLGALAARDFSGEGQHVDVSEWQVLATFYGHTTVLKSFPRAREPLGRRGRRAGGAYPYEVLACQDGYMYLIIMRAREWQRMLEMMGNPEWGKDPKYADRTLIGQKYADEVDDLMLQWFMKHPKQEIFDLAREYSVPFAPVYTAAELSRNPHFQDRGFFVEVDHPKAGRYPYPGAPFHWSETPWQARAPAPLLGQHTAEILMKWLGYSAQEMARLRGSGVI